MNPDQIKEKYLDLKAMETAAYEAAEQQRAALLAAEKPWRDLKREIAALINTSGLHICQTCKEPIFKDEVSVPTLYSIAHRVCPESRQKKELDNA